MIYDGHAYCAQDPGLGGGFDDRAETALERHRRERNLRLVKLSLCELGAGRATNIRTEVIVSKSAVQVFHINIICWPQHMGVVVDP